MIILSVISSDFNLLPQEEQSAKGTQLPVDSSEPNGLTIQATYSFLGQHRWKKRRGLHYGGTHTSQITGEVLIVLCF